MLRIKKFIRRIILDLQDKTEKWVISEDIVNSLDKEEFDKCDELLEERLRIWPNDPAITRFMTLSKFLQGGN